MFTLTCSLTSLPRWHARAHGGAVSWILEFEMALKSLWSHLPFWLVVTSANYTCAHLSEHTEHFYRELFAKTTETLLWCTHQIVILQMSHPLSWTERYGNELFVSLVCFKATICSCFIATFRCTHLYLTSLITLGALIWKIYASKSCLLCVLSDFVRWTWRAKVQRFGDAPVRPGYVWKCGCTTSPQHHQ